MVLFQRKLYYYPKFQGQSNIFREGGGVKMPFPIEPCDFPGVWGQDPLSPPLDHFVYLKPLNGFFGKQ